jgi:hypothetical protein
LQQPAGHQPTGGRQPVAQVGTVRGAGGR